MAPNSSSQPWRDPRTGHVAPRGRGATGNPRNRFERLATEPLPVDEIGRPVDDLDATLGGGELAPDPRTQFLPDASRQILAHNDSPDVGFDVSINIYRGCEHGCAYCYARPTHEYLGFSAGIDFETKIMVKHEAPRLLEQALAAPGWQPQVICMSGVTDTYQPVERRLRLTRGCLQVLAECRNPVALITKNALIARDVDLLARLAEHQAVRASISLTTLDDGLAAALEPRASRPAARLAAIRTLSAAGVPVNVMIAPLIPWINDHEIPALLAAAAEAGAGSAAMVLLRLPHAVAPLFEAWLERHVPGKRARVLAALRAMRGGKLYESRFGQRMRGTGTQSDALSTLFHASRRRAGLDGPLPPLSAVAFRPPGGAQLQLF